MYNSPEDVEDMEEWIQDPKNVHVTVSDKIQWVRFQPLDMSYYHDDEDSCPNFSHLSSF